MPIPVSRVRFQRPEILSGTTYKITPAVINEHIYITINNAEFDEVLRPVEIFVASKNPHSFQWIGVLMRIISAQLQQPGDFPVFVIKELLESYDPEGGYFIPGGIRVPSIAAHIGLVLRGHCAKLGIKDLPELKRG